MLDREHKIALVERAYTEGLATTEATEAIVTDTWAQVISPSLKTSLRNTVYRAVLEEPEADAQIRSTIAHYGALGLPFRWIVTPSSRPTNLGERLLAAGFRSYSTAIGMVGETDRLTVRHRDGIAIEQVGLHNLDDWLAVQARGWKVSEPVIAVARAHLEKELSSGNPAVLDVLVRDGGVIAGGATARFFDGFAHLFGGVILPGHRRRGLYSALVAHRLQLIRERGIPYVTAHCIRETSAPIFQAFGFESVCEVFYYEHG